MFKLSKPQVDATLFQKKIYQCTRKRAIVSNRVLAFEPCQRIHYRQRKRSKLNRAQLMLKGNIEHSDLSSDGRSLTIDVHGKSSWTNRILLGGINDGHG